MVSGDVPGTSSSITGVRPGIRNVSTVKPSMGRCRPQSSISATARSMWPLSAQSASKPGDFAGISMYRVSVGSTSSCHFFWTKVRVSWGGSGVVVVGLMDGTVAPTRSQVQPEVAVNLDAGRTEMRSSGMETDQPAEQQIARLTLLAEARYLPAALAVVREAAAAVGLAAADVTALDRAVEEVASNVIEHGFEPGQRATFDLVVLRRPGQLVVAIEDAGLPFDFSDLEVGQGSSLAAPSLAEFADAIRFSSLGARGNRGDSVKRLPSTPPAPPGPATKPPALPSPPVPATTPVTVRLMTPDDAVAVA